jgi:hypothetical protein
MKLGHAIILAAVGSSYVQSAVFACSCVGGESRHEALERSAAVFAGVPVAANDVMAGALYVSSADPIVYTFVVSSVWKGDIEDTLRVASERDGSSCGYEFRLGQDYLVFANRRHGVLWTGECSGTGAVFSSEWNLYGLPEPQWPTPAGQDTLLSYVNWVAALSSDNAFEATCAAKMLASLTSERDRVIEVFRAALRQGPPNSDVVLRRLHSLGDDARRLAPDVVWLVNNGKADERATALEVARYVVDGHRYCALLAERATDQEIRLQWIGLVSSANRSCSPREQDRMLTILLETMDDSDYTRRLAAANAIPMCGERSLQAVPQLTQMKNDRDMRVRYAAINALHRIEAKYGSQGD